MTDREFIEFMRPMDWSDEDIYSFVEKVGIIMNDGVVEEKDAQIMAYNFIFNANKA